MFLARCCTRNVPRTFLHHRVRAQLFSTGSLLRESVTPGSSKGANVDYAARYADKLAKKAQEQGLSVSALIEHKRDEERARKREHDLTANKENRSTFPSAATSAASLQPTSFVQASGTNVRKDSSPVKPLDSILNFEKLLQKPITAAQLGVLWHGYHQRLSAGTSNGFLSAVVPREAYEEMLLAAQKYPQFILPLPREATSDKGENSLADGASEQKPYEFYFMEWAFHGSPTPPRPVSAVLDDVLHRPGQPTPAKAGTNPQTSTVLFTPLGEYKLRNSFATPYLVLTFYPDLAQTHGVVLVRGEITPAQAVNEAGEQRYLLKPLEAQALSMLMQKFYLWSKAGQEGVAGNDARRALLKTFHEDPAKFQWEELLKHA